MQTGHCAGDAHHSWVLGVYGSATMGSRSHVARFSGPSPIFSLNFSLSALPNISTVFPFVSAYSIAFYYFSASHANASALLSDDRYCNRPEHAASRASSSGPDRAPSASTGTHTSSPSGPSRHLTKGTSEPVDRQLIFAPTRKSPSKRVLRYGTNFFKLGVLASFNFFSGQQARLAFPLSPDDVRPCPFPSP